MVHHYLQNKIQDLWRPTEDFQMIDLGEDYFIIKFKEKDNMEKALQQGPWFINGHFLSITKWKPNFVASKEKLTTTAVWIRLPQLPTEFYDGKILQKIGNAIGRLLKVDVCTSTTLRGRYARLCVELPLEIPVQPFLYVGQYKQHIHYERDNFLCTNCGRLGYTKNQCTFIKLDTMAIKAGTEAQATNSMMEKQEEEWKIVSFSKGKRPSQRNIHQNTTKPINNSKGPGIPVKMFNASTGKYLDTKYLHYKSKDLKGSLLQWI
ncbi:uncharacterized protein [Nicotiana sylvestris]|uniref:uncharacterized protein n=1 Tax=Nicotiana sylvestris TaxID=4096 RepID=UPI00388C9928